MRLAMLSQAQKETFFHLAHNVVVSDGETSTGEHLLMEEMRREMSLPDSFEPHYVELAGVDQIFDTRRSRIVCLISLVQLAYADGAFEIEEQGFLGLLCEQFEVNHEDFRRLDNWVKRLIALETELKDLY